MLKVTGLWKTSNKLVSLVSLMFIGFLLIKCSKPKKNSYLINKVYYQKLCEVEKGECRVFKSVKNCDGEKYIRIWFEIRHIESPEPSFAIYELSNEKPPLDTIKSAKMLLRDNLYLDLLKIDLVKDMNFSKDFKVISNDIRAKQRGAGKCSKFYYHTNLHDIVHGYNTRDSIFKVNQGVFMTSNGIWISENDLPARIEEVEELIFIVDNKKYYAEEISQ